MANQISKSPNAPKQVPCACGCGKTFPEKKGSHRVYYDRGCASRANAKNAHRPKKSYRRTRAGVKEKVVSGLADFAAGMRKYEDEQIALGKLPPRRTVRQTMSIDIKAAQAAKARALAAKRKSRKK